MISDANKEWKERAELVPLLTAAKKLGAKLHKTGSEWVGPCCYCGGQDRLGINPTKGKWVCRGFGGGSSVVSLAMHLGNLSFKSAIEALTGEPAPNGQSKPLSASRIAERERRRAENDAAQQARKEQEAETARLVAES